MPYKPLHPRIFKPRRPLGRTGFTATVLGIGDVADRAVPIGACVATVRRAIDAGLNIVDTAPGYESGYSEEIVGRAVREHVASIGGSARSQLFVIDKIDFIEQPVAPQIDKSLSLLKLDHVDAFVFHALSSMDLWRNRVGKSGGAMSELDDCMKAGKVRYRGISSHHPDVLVEAISSGLCDIVMFPVGPFVDRKYVDVVLPLAMSRNVGTVCFKTFGAGKLLGDTTGYNRPLQVRPRGKLSSGGSSQGNTVTPDDAPQLPRMSVEECVHYTLTCDPDVALLGMSFPNEQDTAFAAARSFRAKTPAEMADIRARAAVAIQGKGGVHWDP